MDQSWHVLVSSVVKENNFSSLSKRLFDVTWAWTDLLSKQKQWTFRATQIKYIYVYVCVSSEHMSALSSVKKDNAMLYRLTNKTLASYVICYLNETFVLQTMDGQVCFVVFIFKHLIKIRVLNFFLTTSKCEEVVPQLYLILTHSTWCVHSSCASSSMPCPKFF